MKVLCKVIGLFLIVFAVSFYQAEPLQKRGHHGHQKSHYRGHPRPKYKKIAYYKSPKPHYKRHYYKPVRHYRNYSYKRQPRVYHSRQVVIVNL